MTPALRIVALALLLGGCAVPSWVPLIGKPKGPPPPAPVAGKPLSPDMPMPGDVRIRPPEHDEGIADRVVAVVNNDAITLSELQETIVAYRAENRQQRGAGPGDDELAKQFLPKLIDSRLQLQEADRERITVDDQEVSDELTERIKIYNAKTLEEFEKLVKEQGITMDSVKKRVREGLRVQKVIRRKVVLRPRRQRRRRVGECPDQGRPAPRSGPGRGRLRGRRPRVLQGCQRQGRRRPGHPEAW